MTSPATASARAEEVAALSRAVADRGLVVAAAGNVSMTSDGLLLITRSGVNLAQAGAADVCRLDGADRPVRARDPLPSSELALHRRCAYADGDTVIVHTHGLYAATVSTIVEALPAIHYYVELLGSPIRVAPYATFGTDELAAGAADALGQGDAVLLANHGALVRARDAATALERAVLLEWLCRVYWQASLAGSPQILTSAQLHDVRAHSAALRAARESTSTGTPAGTGAGR